jgi:succinate dehydrogenase / fumarate reductase cytochrome b subunit
LRAGQGHSFLLRRLHSLSGIVPVGAFLLEHFVSNSFATNGPESYINQVKFLTGLPFALWLEIFGIYLPILFHAGYGFYIWKRGEANLGGAYPWTGNWMYTLQRWSGIVAFAYIIYHTGYMRFSGIHLFDHPDAAFWKVQNEFRSTLAIAVYAVGIASASWHFGYGLFLFAAKWGLVVGDAARERMKKVGIAIALLLMMVGLMTIKAFVAPKADWPRQEFKPEWSLPGHSSSTLETESPR